MKLWERSYSVASELITSKQECLKISQAKNIKIVMSQLGFSGRLVQTSHVCDSVLALYISYSKKEDEKRNVNAINTERNILLASTETTGQEK